MNITHVLAAALIGTASASGVPLDYSPEQTARLVQSGEAKSHPAQFAASTGALNSQTFFWQPTNEHHVFFFLRDGKSYGEYRNEILSDNRFIEIRENYLSAGFRDKPQLQDGKARRFIRKDQKLIWQSGVCTGSEVRWTFLTQMAQGTELRAGTSLKERSVFRRVSFKVPSSLDPSAEGYVKASAECYVKVFRPQATEYEIAMGENIDGVRYHVSTSNLSNGKCELRLEWPESRPTLLIELHERISADRLDDTPSLVRTKCLMSMAIQGDSLTAQELEFKLAPKELAAKLAYSPVRQWQIEDLEHQSEANEVFDRAGFIYVGGGAPKGKISKVNMETGIVAWSYDTGQTYQPSYPVSNGRVVIFGTYSAENFAKAPSTSTFFVGLNDRSGKLLWKVPANEQNMSAACFANDLAFIGSYDRNLYAIDWVKGEVKWKTQLPNLIWSTPCVYGNFVVVGCYDGRLYCMDRKTGKIDSSIDCGGRIESNLVVVNGLLFVLSDNQNVGDPYSSSEVRGNMLVIELRQKKVISRFPSASSFSKKIIVSGKDVYFFDSDVLYAYDSQAAALSWKVKAPAGMAPYPIVRSSKIILAMNYLGMHGEHSSTTSVLDRSTGKQLFSKRFGGIGVREAHYSQFKNTIVTVGWGLVGYKIDPAP